MYTINLSLLNNALSDANFDFSQIAFSNPFCKKAFSNSSVSKKCQKFYSSVVLDAQNSSESRFYKCPYGYKCLVPHNCQVILSNIFTACCDKQKIKDRNNRFSHKEVIVDEELILKRFEKYNRFIELLSLSDSISHDINNALSYFLELSQEHEEKHNNFMFKSYSNIRDKVSELQNITAFCDFDLNCEYNVEPIVQKIEELFLFIEKISKLSEDYLKTISQEDEKDYFCSMAGFSLLKAMIYRSVLSSNLLNIKYKKSSFSIHKVVKKIVSLLSFKANNKGVAFPVFIGSPTQNIDGIFDDVFTAVFTVVDNAIKYSEPGENISIYFKEDLTNSHIILSIENCSREIPQNEIDRLHDRGFRGSNKTPKGKGLGLHIVKTICERNSIGYNARYEKRKFIYTFTFNISK